MTAAATTTQDYTETMRETLRRAYGGCKKRVAGAAGANIEAAKNWLDGRNAPSGPFLIRLMRDSDEVFAAILELAGRAEQAKKSRALAIVRQLEQLLEPE